MRHRILIACTALLLSLVAAPPAQAAPRNPATVSSRSTQLVAAKADLALPRAQRPDAVGTAASPTVQTARQDLADEVAVAAVVLPDGEQPDEVWVRGIHDGVADAWSVLPVDATDGADQVATEPFVLTGADAVEVATVAGAPVAAELVVHTSAVVAADAQASDLAWDSPRILSRKAWQANEAIVKLPYERGEVTGAMIHHTAGTNDYTAAQVPAILRSIQAYHVNGRGWKDMGYNVLVDKFGRAWEGRGGGVNQAIAGGHGFGETNYRTFGISLMGDYGKVQPSAAMLESANQVIAWKLQMHEVDPFGETFGSGGQDGGSTWLPAISGHRDENATLCPGQHVYAKMGQIRTRVKAIMDSTRFPRFRDVPLGMQFEPDMRWLALRNVTTGWPDGTYRPWQPIARDAMAAFIYRLAGSPEWVAPEESLFSDVPPGTQFYPEITWLAATGITTGWSDGTFRPLDPVNRDAMAAYLYRLYGKPERKASPPVFSDINATTDFVDEIAWLADTGITTGWKDGTFRPVTPVNRDAMAAFMHRAVDTLGEPIVEIPEPEPTPEPTPEPKPEPEPGPDPSDPTPGPVVPTPGPSVPAPEPSPTSTPVEN